MESLIRYGLQESEKLAVPFAEIRGDDLIGNEITMEKGEIKTTSSLRRVGLAVRIVDEGVEGFAYTTKLDKASIREVISNAYTIARISKKRARIRLTPAPTPILEGERSQQVKRHPRDVEFEEKKEMMVRSHQTAAENGVSVSTIVVRYGEAYGVRVFGNTEGTFLKVHPLLVSTGAVVVSKEADVLVDARDAYGGSLGLEAFTGEHSPEAMGRNAAVWASEKLKAEAAPSGKFPALINSRLAGVLAHESFGHMSECDFVITGGSPLKDMKGKKVGSEQASIIDQGVLESTEYPGYWLPFDDEGVETKKTTILQEGILRTYLHSRGTAGKLDDEPTGNARAIDYRFAPICRMRNTYFPPGDLTREEALELLGDGVYALDTSGGEASLDGTFLFKAVRGYWVERGEIKKPLRDVALTGHILDLLKNVEGRTKELQVWSSYFGGCGKGDQYPLHAGLGGPEVLIRNVLFGGG